MKKILIGIFLSFIGGLGLLNILAEDQLFSERENRVLSQMPSITYKNFFSGDFSKDFEEYINDQFVWKEFWTGMKADAEMIVLKQENNEIMIGKDGFLLEGYRKPGDQLQSNIDNLQVFAEKTKDLTSYLLLAPTSVEIHKEKVPMFAPSYSQKKIMTMVKGQLAGAMEWIDVYDSLLSKKEESIYFRTDHHWTMRGAYYAYIEAARAMGIKAYKMDDFMINTVSADFYGTYFSKANANRVEPDKIEVFEPKFDVTYHVQYEDDKNSTNSLYEWDYLNKKDQYALFLNGNHSLVNIKSSIQNGRKLMVIKDSYAHSFIPFLANHFEEIHVIDLRYYHLNVNDYLKQNEISEVLFLYNLANFSKDTNLIWLKQ